MGSRLLLFDFQQLTVKLPFIQEISLFIQYLLTKGIPSKYYNNILINKIYAN